MLFFECTDDTMMARLLERAKTSGRVDDNEETIKLRLNTFHELTQPAIEYYRDNEKLITVSKLLLSLQLKLIRCVQYPIEFTKRI